MASDNEINQLKAQVNCLRDVLRATHDFLWKAGVADYIARDIEKALEVTPEQCLAEVKAKAWDEGYCFGVADERTSELIKQQEQAHNDRMGRDEISTKIEPARNNPYKS